MEEYSYVYTGGKLMQMVVKTTTTPVDGTATTTTETLNFSYDASGVPLALDYNGTDYYYVANIQGDVMAILNTSGTAVVEYTYDAWGKLYSTTGTLAGTLGEANPLTYRGYVYDQDSGYYYLQSRYYDPEVGRFINADGLVTTGQGLLGNNMFAYCNNFPVGASDPSGESAIVALLSSAAAAIGVGATVGAVAALCTFASGGNAEECLDSFLYATVATSTSILFPSAAPYIAGFSAVKTTIESWKDGASPSGGILAGLSSYALSSVSFGSTGDVLTDQLVSATFGVGKELITTGAEIAFTEGMQLSEDADTMPCPLISPVGGGSKDFARIFTVICIN